MFQIDLVSLIKVKASLSKQFHIQPSEIDRMAFWEYEFYLNAINDIINEENEQQKKEMDKYDIDGMMNAAHPKNMNKMMSGMTSKMPDFGKMSMPSPGF